MWILIITALVSSVWSFLGTRHLDVWFFELIPGVLGVCGIAVIGRWFRFSLLVYVVISLAFICIATGARYTYAEVPVAKWLGQMFGTSRNHFDRVGHFVQGLTVGLMTREVLIRTTTLSKRCGVIILSIAFALAFSAFYELVEWWTVLAFYAEHGPEWLGMQGDPWDAQEDMLMALLGVFAATILLSRIHDRSIHKVTEPADP